MSSTQQLLLGEGAGGAAPVYIEDVFSTYLYTGNGSTQTITNGIDLSGKGGLVWQKRRNSTSSHYLFDTARGNDYVLNSNTTSSQGSGWSPYFSFGSSGFSVDAAGGGFNLSNATYASWTFREQAKFFDIVTYTGTGTNTTIAHNLGSVPGCIIVKRTDTTSDWQVYHRSNANTQYMVLNTSAVVATGATRWNSTTPTSTVFSLGTDATVNASAGTYVAYVFAHDAGGFGLTGTDNVIRCGSFDVDSSGNVNIELGFEPQWVLVKDITNTQQWIIFDTMRGFPNAFANGPNAVQLIPNSSNAEAGFGQVGPTATGFGTNAGQLNASSTYIYIAIRRGPMKVPTSGTSVFAPLTYTGNGTSGRYISGAGFPPDLLIQTARSTSENREFDDRLRGGGSTAMNALFSNSTNAEAADSGSVQLLNQDGFTVRSFGNGSSVTYIGECFRRAPSFFDEVCWTSTGSFPQVLDHNLTVAPELIIRKPRSIADEWAVGFNFQTSSYKKMALNTTAAQTSYGSYSSGEFPGKPTATQFTDQGSASGRPFVAYLFATCAGVSKVGSYTGTGTTLQIDCGFTGGARFVLIKRASSTGDWYVWDSARGIVSGNDPYLLLNNTDAEVTNTDYIDTYSAGFEISSTAPAAINASAGTFVFLAIA